jgi:hypothetical protein
MVRNLTCSLVLRHCQLSYDGNAVSLRCTETAKLANARNTVVTQLQENEMVKKVRLTFFRITEQLQLGY